MSIREMLKQLALERILILDGAIGSMVQACRTSAGEPISEDDFRGLTGEKAAGERFRNHPVPLKGCNDLLCITMPSIVSGIHEAYLKAGADIIETCSFNANAVSLADYGLGDLAYELSLASARLARNAADSFSASDKRRFVAGSIGPTSKSASMPIDMNNPGKRAITWDELDAAYYDNARGLLDGGADLLIIETIFDTLNAKAAIFAVRRLAAERGIDVPLIISATVSSGGRLLSGQSIPAFCVSVQHADPLAIGLNCSFGANKLKPHIAAISEAVARVSSPCLICAYPNAGFPNQMGVYDENPESMANCIEDYMRDGLVNIVGGCCGTTPSHVAAIAEKACNYAPRVMQESKRKTFLSGTEILEVSREHFFSHVGTRANVAKNGEFLDLVKKGDLDGAVDIAREMKGEGAALIDVCMQDDALDEKEVMAVFLNNALLYPDIGSLPVILNSSRWDVIEAGLKCLQGKGLVNSISLKDGESEFLRKALLARAYGAAVIVTLSDEEGQAVSYKHRISIADRSWKLLMDLHFPPEDIVLDPYIFSRAVLPLSAASLPKHIPILVKQNILPLKEARKNKVQLYFSDYAGMEKGKDYKLADLLELPGNLENDANIFTINEYPKERVIPYVDWVSFIQAWDLAMHTYPSAYYHASREEEIRNLDKVLADAKILLEKINVSDLLHLRGVVGFFPAFSEGDDIVLPGGDPGLFGPQWVVPGETVRFCFLRNQELNENGSKNPCLADYIIPQELYNQKIENLQPKGRTAMNFADYNPALMLGLFALSAGFGLKEAEREFRSLNDDYNALLLAGLANALIEAFSEDVHRRLSMAWVDDGSEAYGIRPVFGYPACPDHWDKEIVCNTLGVRQRCGLELIENAMFIPAASVCGMYMAHADSRYFKVGMIGDDQMNDWANRKGISPKDAEKRLGAY